MLSLEEIVSLAINEDLPNGDLTTDSLKETIKHGTARIVAKSDLVISGIPLVNECMKQVDPSIHIEWQFNEGDQIVSQQTVCLIDGPLNSILKAERISLNFLGHFSGIASLTKKFANEVKGTKTKILDTRKTTPLFRLYEKAAVVHGGGCNHRMNLSEAVLVKENHIRAGGGIMNTLNQLKDNISKEVEIEVEVQTLEEALCATELGIKRILLDNMDNETTKEIINKIPKDVKTEASGNMTLERVRSVAELGVDFISIGGLTHSAPSADLSLLFDWN